MIISFHKWLNLVLYVLPNLRKSRFCYCTVKEIAPVSETMLSNFIFKGTTPLLALFLLWNSILECRIILSETFIPQKWTVGFSLYHESWSEA